MTQNIIDVLGINTLALRGLGTEFNRFSRFFQSIEDARQSVLTGDYTPTPGVTNAVLILGIGIAVWSFDLQDFVDIAELQAAGNQANRYIELDGANDYIEFENLQGGTEKVLDLSHDWSIGVTLVGLGPVTSDQKYVTLFSNGNNVIYLRRGGTNWGFYVSGNGGSTRAGANTWYAPTATSRILITYNASTQRMKYYLGDVSTGSYGLRANYLASSQAGLNGVGSTFCVGKKVGSDSNDLFWDGGVNNLIISDTELVGPQIDEYFQSGDPFPDQEYYADLTTYANLGEDIFPAVNDTKGNAEGELKGGAANDFVDIPTE